MLQAFGVLAKTSAVVSLVVFLLIGWKHDDVYVIVQPHLDKVHAWSTATWQSTFSEPVPWSPRYRVPDTSRGDVLRRRDFSSNSLEPVPINRPRDPLQGLDLSESFQKVWYKILELDPNLPREYRASLEAIVAEDKMAGCGSWVQDYTLRHKQMLQEYNDTQAVLEPHRTPSAGSRTRRLIAACFKRAGQCGGLGDRMFGHASTFVMSLLLDRAFLMHVRMATVEGLIYRMFKPLYQWSYDFPVLAEETWESPFLNWAWQAPPPAENELQKSVDPGDPRLGNKHTLFIQSTGEWLDQYFNNATREHIETETFPGETMTVQGNKGLVLRTMKYESTWQSHKLRSMGFTEEKAWGCILNYLVNPVPDTAKLIVKYQALLRMPSVFSVGVQVRAGDWVFQPEKHTGMDWNNVRQYDYFLKCAADAAIAFADPDVHKHFVIFLVTDNNNFARAAAKDPYYFLEEGWVHPTIPNFEPMVISMGETPIHLEKGDDEKHQGQHNTFSMRKRHYAMQTSIVDNYVFDATDKQLICSWSGFGLLSHLRAAARQGDSAIPMGPTGPEGGMPPLSAEGYPCNSTKAFWPLDRYREGAKLA